MTMLKQKPVDHKQAESLINDLIKQFNAYGNPSKIPTEAELEHFFSQNMTLKINDQFAAHNLNELLEKIRFFQKEYSNANYSKLLEAALFDGNKAAIRYNVDVVAKSGKKIQFQIFALLTFEDGKIAHLNQIIHEKGTGHFNA